MLTKNRIESFFKEEKFLFEEAKKLLQKYHKKK